MYRRRRSLRRNGPATLSAPPRCQCSLRSLLSRFRQNPPGPLDDRTIDHSSVEREDAATLRRLALARVHDLPRPRDLRLVRREDAVHDRELPRVDARLAPEADAAGAAALRL